MTALSLTVGYVPGGTPAKWARNWAQRHREVPLTLTAVAAAGAADAVLLEVDQVGGACHTGDHSCFDADLLLEPPTA